MTLSQKIGGTVVGHAFSKLAMSAPAAKPESLAERMTRALGVFRLGLADMLLQLAQDIFGYGVGAGLVLVQHEPPGCRRRRGPCASCLPAHPLVQVQLRPQNQDCSGHHTASSIVRRRDRHRCIPWRSRACRRAPSWHWRGAARSVAAGARDDPARLPRRRR